MKSFLIFLGITLISTVASAQGFQSWIEIAHMADKNTDGMISPSEVMYFEHSKEAAGFQPFMVDHFAAFDTNGDGQVSMEEIEAGMKAQNMTDDDMLRAFFEMQGFQPPRNK